jgi:hypothetical protein
LDAATTTFKNGTMDEEQMLQQELMDTPPAPYTRLVEHEWTGMAGRGEAGVAMDHIGKGDLVFQVPGKTLDYLVVETRHLRTEEGRGARAQRNTSRRKVKEQAFRYGAIWRGHMGTVGATVTVATYTNAVISLNGNEDENDDFDTATADSSDRSRKLEILGQIDYLTPQLWNDGMHCLLTEEERNIIHQEHFQRIFMAVRIHEPLISHDFEIPYTPERFQEQFDKSIQASWKPSNVYQSLENIAESVLNRSGFYQPFGPHFVIAPNCQRQLLRDLQALLKRLK